MKDASYFNAAARRAMRAVSFLKYLVFIITYTKSNKVVWYE